MRFLLRALGLFFLACTTVWAVIDATQSVAVDRVLLSSFGQAWVQASPALLDALENFLRSGPLGGFGDVLWASVTVPILRAPAVVVFFVIAAVCLILGRRSRRRSSAALV